MIPSRLLWRIFGTYALLTLVSATILVSVLSQKQRDLVVERVKQRLHDSAVLLRDDMRGAFQGDPEDRLQRRLQDLAKQTGSRLTLITEDGSVVGDSEEEPDAMENHRNREELLQAKVSEFGVSQRQSPTLGIPMMYVALRVGEPSNIKGYVRVAVPMDSVQAEVAAAQRLILVTTVLVSLAALSLTYALVGRILRPLATLTTAARSIAEGANPHEVDIASRDELGTLAESFNSMSQQLTGRIRELDRKGQEFAQNSNRLEAVLGGMVEGVIAIGAQQEILFANRAAQSLLELSVSEVVGRPIWETVRHPAIQQVVGDALEKRTRSRTELELSRTDSTVEVLATRLPGDPCPGVIMVLHDITELRRLENVRRQFVSNVSHELKTPLTSIQAYTETLLQGAIDDKEHNREFLRRIEEQADRLHSLILDLLRLATIESGADAFAIGKVSLDEVVVACLQDHEALARAKQISLVAEPNPDALCVLADEEGVRTILDNLVENAISYTPENGRVDIRFSAEDSMARIEVEDTGVGIAEEHQERIFERFYRVDRARSRELGGTGLGLSIVKHLALAFDGTVALESTPGVGTEFTVRLPRVPSAE